MRERTTDELNVAQRRLLDPNDRGTMTKQTPTETDGTWTRRRILGATGVVAGAGLAGCTEAATKAGLSASRMRFPPAKSTEASFESSTSAGDRGRTGFPPAKHTEWGAPVEIGEGEAKTFVTTTPDGKLKFVGVHFTAATLKGLPSEPPANWPEGVPFSQHNHLQLPEGVDAGAFEWVGMGWNPQGHEPQGIYTVPHFDFHFYLMDHEDVEAITFGPALYDIPADQLPAGYIRPPVIDTDGDGRPDTPLVVPRMGEHLVDPASPEFQGEPFTHTFIWGAYDPALLVCEGGDGTGELTFMEPMVTKAFFEEQNEEVATPIKMPTAFPEAGRYPTTYVLRYHGNDDAYTVTLEGFEPFEASSA